MGNSLSHEVNGGRSLVASQPFYPCRSTEQEFEDDEPQSKSSSYGPSSLMCAKELRSFFSNSSVRDLYSADLISQEANVGPIWAFSFTPDGRQFAAGTEFSEVIVYENSTYKAISFIERVGNTRSVEYSPDGKYLAIGGDDQKLAIYETKDYEMCDEVVVGGSIRSLTYSPDGKHIAFAGKMGKVALYDTETRKIVQEHVKGSTAWTLAYSPNGQYISVGGHDRKIVVHRSDNLKVVKEFERGGSIKALAYSPDGRFVVAGYNDHRLEIYDSSTYAIIHSHKRSGPVECVAYTVDGKTILAGGWDSKVALYDASTFEVLREYRRGGTIWAVACCPSGKLFLAGGDDSVLAIYNATICTASHDLKKGDNARAVIYSPNGKLLAAGGHDKTLTLCNTSTMEVVTEVKREGTIRAIKFSPCGQRLAVAGEYKKVTVFGLSETLFGTIEVCSEHFMETKMKGSVFALDFSPDGTQLAIGGSENKIIFLNSNDLTFVNEIQREGWVRTITYSPDGKYIAAGGDDKTVTVYDTETSAKVHEHERTGWVFALAFSPDSTRLAAGGNDKKLSVYDVSSFRIIHENEDYEIAALAFSPNGKYLAGGGSGKELFVLDADDYFEKFINPLCFPRLISALSFHPSDMDLTDNYATISVANGRHVTSMKLHAYATTPIEVIIRNSNDAEIVGMIERQNVSTHEQVRLMCAANALDANSESDDINRNELIAGLIDENPSYGLLAMENIVDDRSNEILKGLEQYNQLVELNAIARCGAFRSRILESDLNEMHYVVLQLARKQFKSSVVNFLNAGENGSLPGFVNVKDTHLLKETSNGAYLPSWIQPAQSSQLTQDAHVSAPLPANVSDVEETTPNENGKKEIIQMPLSESLGPRTFNTANVSEAWGDLKKDKREQIQVKIIRGLIPGLGSFESLKAFTEMNDNEPFETHALRAAIDCHWSNWARKKFIFQALWYIFSLACYSALIFFNHCSEGYTDDIRWIVYVLSAIIFADFFLVFMLRECTQFMILRMAYFRDWWNAFQWVTKVLICVSVAIRLTVREETEAGAVVSGLGLLLGWFGLLFYFRGIEGCAWIVTALFHIAGSMVYFVVVLLTVLLGFSFFFHSLSRPSTCPETCGSKGGGYNRFGCSFISVFDAGVNGGLDTDESLELYSYAPIFERFMMIVLSLTVTLISLNALIAFISAAFEDVLTTKLSALKKQKASIILDLYSVLSKAEREKIEEKNRWTTFIVPVERLESDAKKATQNDALKSKVEHLRTDVEGVKGDVKAILALMQVLKSTR
jgi:WD40 repeat protein